MIDSLRHEMTVTSGPCSRYCILYLSIYWKIKL